MKEPTKVNLSMKEIYERLCPECQKKVIDMIKDKMTTQAIEKSLTEEK